MSEYDPFHLPELTIDQQKDRHFLDSNGLSLFADYKDSFLNEKCLCGCIRKQHLASDRGTLDDDSICLNSQCLCEGFVKKEGAKVTIAKANGKIPRKVLVPEIQENPILNSYIQTMSKI